MREVRILPADTVLCVTREAITGVLDQFASESRRDEEMRLVLRLVGITPPYEEWQEVSDKTYCFRNEAQQRAEERVISRTLVSSSNIASIGYCGERQTLEVEYHSIAIYQYYRVAEYLFRGADECRFPRQVPRRKHQEGRIPVQEGPVKAHRSLAITLEQRR